MKDHWYCEVCKKHLSLSRAGPMARFQMHRHYQTKRHKRLEKELREERDGAAKPTA